MYVFKSTHDSEFLSGRMWECHQVPSGSYLLVSKWHWLTHMTSYNGSGRICFASHFFDPSPRCRMAWFTCFTCGVCWWLFTSLKYFLLIQELATRTHLPKFVFFYSNKSPQVVPIRGMRTIMKCNRTPCGDSDYLYQRGSSGNEKFKERFWLEELVFGQVVLTPFCNTFQLAAE